jgi:hypothetical protein
MSDKKFQIPFWLKKTGFWRVSDLAGAQKMKNTVQ